MWKWLTNQVFIPFLEGLRRLRAKLKPPATPSLVPKIIPFDPAHVPTGPNLVPNPGFEDGIFPAGATHVDFQGFGTIAGWRSDVTARWIDVSHPVLNQAAGGSRFVDLTGGIAPGPTRKLAQLHKDSQLGIQAGKRYEAAVHLGVGPDLGPSANYGPPVSIRLRLFKGAVQVEQQFVANPTPPNNVGVVWERFAFRFHVPSGTTITNDFAAVFVTGVAGYYLVAVDEVSLHELT